MNVSVEVPEAFEIAVIFRHGIMTEINLCAIILFKKFIADVNELTAEVAVLYPFLVMISYDQDLPGPHSLKVRCGVCRH